MGIYSVAEAKDRLPALIAAAERGESVTITRYGRPVAEIRAVEGARPLKRVTPESLDWIRQQLAHLPPPREDAATVVRRMRDETDDL